MMVVVVKLVTVVIRTIMFSLVVGGTVIGLYMGSLSGASFGKDEESNDRCGCGEWWNVPL